MTMFLNAPIRSSLAGRLPLVVIGLAFAAGVALGASGVARIAPAVTEAAPSTQTIGAAPATVASPAPSASRAGHPADVLRVIDGDTFEARVHVWPGLDITTKVRLRGVDAPEMRA